MVGHIVEIVDLGLSDVEGTLAGGVPRFQVATHHTVILQHVIN